MPAEVVDFTQAPAATPCRINSDPDVLSGLLTDASHYTGGRAVGVARPSNENELAWVLAEASRRGWGILPIGSQSSLTGGAVPFDDLLVQTTAFTDIGPITGGTIRLGAGVLLSQLLPFLREKGYYYPPVPTYQLSTIGGNVATNAAGSATFKYGSTREWVRGLRVLTVDGWLLDIRRGEHVAASEGFRLRFPDGTERFLPVPTYKTPAVKKCSMGYPGGPKVDLMDVFVGSEGTLGLVTAVDVGLVPVPASVLSGFIFVPDEAQAVRIVDQLRAASERFWRREPGERIDIRAIEHMDGASLDLLRARGVRLGVPVPPEARQLLYFEMELPESRSDDSILEDLEGALEGSPPATATGDLFGLLARVGVLDRLELALPGQPARAAALKEVREAVPMAVNETVRERQAQDPAVRKLAGDMCVPFKHFEEMLQGVRHQIGGRGLEYVVFGHISDGNVHPNILARSAEEMQTGRDALLAVGAHVQALGGTPLAEHGVGRNPLKQELMRRHYGDDPIAQMRSIKAVLDPDWRLSRGVLFSEK